MYVIGTAGHVDHGKSSLVEALTGINPDRLVEEQRRGMTIELGFAWLELAAGQVVSLVDVPGHERFIKQMLAGVSGFDAALLVVAADESVMPQTREHVAIIDLLEIPRGLVVVTKADLVEPAWLPLVVDDIRAQLVGTMFAAAPLVVVSAKTGQGLAELRTALTELVAAIPQLDAQAAPTRLWIDRVFSMDGFGAVVTGTLQGASVAVGDAVELAPRGTPTRIRGLQIHRQKVTQAGAGTRVAMNLAGVSHHDIARGDVVAVPGQVRPTDRIDVELTLAAVAPRPLPQGMRVDVFVGSAETPARVTLLDSDALAPGERRYAQLYLERPLPLWRGDRIVLRQPSPSLTVAGGRVIDTHPLRHRRHRPEVIARLDALRRASPADLVWAALAGAVRSIDELCAQTHLDAARVHETVAQLAQAQPLSELYVADRAAVLAYQQQVEKSLVGYRERFPLRVGMPREEVRRRLGVTPGVFDALVTVWAGVVEKCGDGLLRLVGAEVVLTPAQQRQVDQVLQVLAQQPYAPPTLDVDRELLQYILGSGAIVALADDIVFAQRAWQTMVAWVLETIDTSGSVTVGQFRDRFDTTRKYALAVLEQLDAQKITRREGDGRVRF